MRQRISIAVFLLSCNAISGFGQTTNTGPPNQPRTPPPVGEATNQGSIPPAGDPEVFLMFLENQNHLLQDIQKLRAEDPKRAGDTEAYAAARLKISPADFAKIDSCYRTLKKVLDSLNAETLEYVKQARSKKQDTDENMLRQFYARRKQLLRSAMSQLQASLSPIGWDSIRGFIDGEFRNGIRMHPAP